MAHKFRSACRNHFYIALKSEKGEPLHVISRPLQIRMFAPIIEAHCQDAGTGATLALTKRQQLQLLPQPFTGSAVPRVFASTTGGGCRLQLR